MDAAKENELKLRLALYKAATDFYQVSITGGAGYEKSMKAAQDLENAADAWASR